MDAPGDSPLTEAVLRAFANCRDARLRAVVTSLVRHLHGFVREVAPSEAEWLAAIRFLTETGQMCDATRQEFILLSDVLGVSTLVEQINNEAGGGGTEASVLGPFFVADAPLLPDGAAILRDGTAPTLTVEARVTGPDGAPVAGAEVDVWQTAPNGLYDVQDAAQPAMNLRARFRAGADGCFAFRTVPPTSYPIPHDGPVGRLLAATGRHPWRPAHLHVMIVAEGYRRLTTALYFAGDPYLESDAVFGVKPGLIVRPEPMDEGQALLRYAFTLERAG